MLHILHKLKPRKCIENAKWTNHTLYCSKCKEPIAIRFMISDEIRLYTFGKYKRYERKIGEREDTKGNTKDGDYLGKLSYGEFEEIPNSIRQWKDDLFFASSYGDGISEDCESEDTSGTGEIHDVEEIATNPEFGENLEEKS